MAGAPDIIQVDFKVSQVKFVWFLFSKGGHSVLLIYFLFGTTILSSSPFV